MATSNPFSPEYLPDDYLDDDQELADYLAMGDGDIEMERATRRFFERDDEAFAEMVRDDLAGRS